MENFLRDGVDMQVLSSGTIAGEAHFFDDATTPSKVRSYLDSSKVEFFSIIAITIDNTVFL